MPNTFTICDYKIGPEMPPFIVAEMSGNHNQSLEKAIEIVDMAASSGAHALKIQTYTADTMTLDLQKNEFFISDEKSLWKGKSLYELYKLAHTPWEWHKTIFERCKEKGIICFSTPFDSTSVDFLETLNAPCYKIASFENTDLKLIKKVAQTQKPIIVSTGMANISEISDIVSTIKKEGNDKIILLKCTSSYPATPENSNIRTIPHLKEAFDINVGLSDHTLGIGVAVASVALGAAMIEKHFTTSRAEGGVDSAFSLEPNEMSSLVKECHHAFLGLGKINYGLNSSEEKSLVFRRSLYISKDVKKGESITEENMRSIRPGLGLSPKFFDLLLGKKIRKDLPQGTPLSWDLFE